MFPVKNGLIPDSAVIDLLNAESKGIRDKLTMIPSNLMTMEEAAETIRINDKPITVSRVLGWVNNGTAPHYRLSSHCVRIPGDLLEQWVQIKFCEKPKRGS